MLVRTPLRIAKRLCSGFLCGPSTFNVNVWRSFHTENGHPGNMSLTTYFYALASP